MKTRISVIIPIYNVQEFLEECIDSVIHQTINKMPLNDGYERNLQVILVDDGSTDDSAAIAKEYAKQYDYIQYEYEENQGLGHARNYGCQFAEGDYIIFLDSDDVVPPNAYKLMYDAAVKNNSDMTIGAVQRFNSKGYWSSNIHLTAFSGTDLVSHITKDPNLFYDTTSWNKLIKRAFWEEHNFQFPEGILYEDIPVTMPMHFLANNVSIVHEICYLWRVREGISKSITQTTDDLKNLNDRLSVMKMVDTFFKNNVTDSNLFKVKDIKWLKIDLMIFINKLKSILKEDAQDIVDTLSQYIKENIDTSLFNELNELEQLKYENLLNGNIDTLFDILNFEFEDLKHASLQMNNSHLYLSVPEEIFGTNSLCVDKMINDAKITRYIDKVSLDKKCISVTGFAIIPGLKDTDFNDRKYSFYLINCNTRKTMPLDHKDIKIKDLSTFNIRFGDSFSYDAAGYKISVPYNRLVDNPDFTGENRIVVTFTQNGITHSFYAGCAKKNVRNVSALKARMKGDNYFSIDYDFSNELIINVHPVKYRFEKIAINNELLCLYCDSYLGNLFMHYDEDSINKERRLPFVYDENNKYYYININSISEMSGQIQYEDGTPVVYKWKKFMCFQSDYGQLIINALRDYYFDVRKLDSLTLATDVSLENSIVNFTTTLYAYLPHGKKPKSAILYFKDEMNEVPFPISTATCSLKDGKLYSQFRFNLADKKITENLYQGFHEFFIDYDFGEDTLTTPLYIEDAFDQSYVDKLYDYRIYRSKYSTIRLQSTRKWAARENTEAKRLAISQSKYKFFRHLPIKKKRIIFESMWGSKYSCNPRYLYEYIDENYPEYECIWSLTDEHTPIKGNGIRVRRNSLKYFYYLATSKYFVNNVNFHPHYVKRKGQIEIQTMHGTPLKTLGLDVPGDFRTKKQEQDYIDRCKRWNYLTVQSDFVSEISKQCFLFDKEVLRTGYPRTDILYTKNNEKDINALKKKMGLPLNKKIILYAPTWRIKNKFDLMLNLDSMKASLSDEYVIILRLHHFSVAGWTQPEKDDFVFDFSKYDSVEELYLVSDLLITDYSSVMFDYSILDRPIILFTYDMEEYKEKLRGLYIDIVEDKPGPILYTSKEVEDAIINLEETEREYKPFREKFRQKFIQYECENSSEKIFNAVMKK